MALYRVIATPTSVDTRPEPERGVRSVEPGVHARKDPTGAAIIASETGEIVTKQQLDERSNQAAQLFRALGLEVGDTVALLLENRPELLELAWGAQRSGLYYTTVNTHLTASEVAYIVNDCDAQVLVTSGRFAEIAIELSTLTPKVQHRLSLGDDLDEHSRLEELLDAQPTTPVAEQIEGSDFLYSSGSTGHPKGIRKTISGAPLGTPPAVVGLVRRIYDLDEWAVYLSPAPLYHAAPLRFCMAVLRLGGCVVLMGRFDPTAFLHAIERWHVTHTQVVPTMFVRLLKLPDAVRTSFDLSSLRVAIHGAGPCPPQAKHEMIEWWGPIIHEYYSATEGVGFVGCSTEEWLQHPGTVGRALVGEVFVVGGDGTVLPAGEIGDVYFAGGAPFEYYNDSAKTLATRNDRGWTTVGDIGRMDEDGYVYLTDRRANMIISGGVNIYPQEAENILAMHPEVADVAVFGVPHADLGEEARAVVRLVDPAKATDATAQALISFCRDQLAGYKCPRAVEFDAELRRDDTGKLRRTAMRGRGSGPTAGEAT